MARPLRYSFILATVALCAGLAAAGGWRYARASSPVNGPIILISVDSLRADRLPVYGYNAIETPAISALAADGIVFDRAYSHSPETLPSHASMLSGRLPVDTGVRDDAGFVVKDGERLLAQLLRDRGYATAGIVSTFALRKDSGIGQGFTFFDDKMSPAAPGVAVGEVARDGAESERVAERWLDANGTSRCFLFLQIDASRPPGAAAGEDGYDAQVVRADATVGRLLEYLKTHQLYDRSTILFTAGHGEGLGSHGEQGHGLFVYEEVLHVPLIVKQAAGEGAGHRVGELVEHVDLVPTLLDLAKAPDPGNLRGQSLRPLLDDTGHITGRLAYAESFFGRYHFGWHELTTVTDGHYRYVSAPAEELYDLERDPAETHNIAASAGSAPVIAPLRTALNHLKSPETPAPSAISEQDRERFEALGDVGREMAADPADAELADPKDTFPTLVTYRSAVELALKRQWPDAIEKLQSLVRKDPTLVDVWRELARFAFDADRNEQSVDAYKHIIAILPEDVPAHLGVTAALVRLRRYDDARQHAELAATAARPKDAAARSSAHEWLARIAIAKRDSAEARAQATLAKEADPTLPLPLFVDGRLLYDQTRYADALPIFEQAAAAEKASHSRPIADFHFDYADTLMHLQRSDDAEAELVAELKAFPRNTRARATLATLEHNAGRLEDAESTLSDLVRLSPTADSYGVAARLWASFGNRAAAAAARAESARLAAAPQAAH